MVCCQPPWSCRPHCMALLDLLVTAAQCLPMRAQRAQSNWESSLVGAGAVDAGSHDAWLGILLVLTSALAWSTMGLFVRMVPDVDMWNVVFWRCIFGGPSIIALAMIERKRWSFEWRRTMAPAGIGITSLIATGLFASIYSMQNTTIANGGVIYSTVPFMAAILAWLWFRERPGVSTIFCTFAAIVGVVVTVSGTVNAGGGHLKGDLAMV